ncbi:MAG: VOC family protein [Deltaproteobacteria bacterium]|nr:VOC family protein [Deltaproteobacteria bacterium]MBI3294449.1 VOC family protein [Deltaproteobacteria bacterium]
MATLAISHVTLATEDVERMTGFFGTVFEVMPYFANKEFSEFVLKSGFRVAFFRPVGKTAKTFDASGSRKVFSLGITVSDVDAFFTRYESLNDKLGGSHEGAPKSHPWGEKSFLLIDPDGNHWEVTQSPSQNGMLVNRKETRNVRAQLPVGSGPRSGGSRS